MRKSFLFSLFIGTSVFALGSISDVKAVDVVLNCSSIETSAGVTQCFDGSGNVADPNCGVHAFSLDKIEGTCDSNPFGTIDLPGCTVNQNETEYFCSFKDSQGATSKYCCPSSLFAKGDPSLVTGNHIECPNRPEEFRQALEDAYDGGDIAGYLYNDVGCDITYLDNGNALGCSIDGVPVYCLNEGDPDQVGYSDSNTGCNNVGEEDKNACLACMYVNSDQDAGELTGAVWTAIGCVDPSPSGIITRLYQIGVGIVGGLLLIIKVPQIVIAYNSNNPEKKQEAQAGIWNVAGGLLLLIFASAVLEALGLHVLGLPRGFI